jgi:glutamyl-tRNA synthetase
MSAE